MPAYRFHPCGSTLYFMEQASNDAEDDSLLWVPTCLKEEEGGWETKLVARGYLRRS
jgi:hypothetical protein